MAKLTCRIEIVPQEICGDSLEHAISALSGDDIDVL